MAKRMTVLSLLQDKSTAEALRLLDRTVCDQARAIQEAENALNNIGEMIEAHDLEGVRAELRLVAVRVRAILGTAPETH